MKVIDDIVNAYVEAARGDLREALRRAVGDALADLLELERRTRCAERLVSKGYVRAALHRQRLDEQQGSPHAAP